MDNDSNNVLRLAIEQMQKKILPQLYWGGPCGAHVFEGFFGLEDEPVKSVKMKVETRSGILWRLPP